MVGFDPAIESLQQHSKPDDATSPSDLSILEFPDFSLSLLDPLPEFDCIEDWIMETDSVDVPKVENPFSDQFVSKRMEFGCSENGSFANGSDANPVKTDDIASKVETGEETGGKSIGFSFQETCVIAAVNVKIEEGVVPEGLGSSIEEEMRKVSLLADSHSEGSEGLPKLKPMENGDEVNEVDLVSEVVKTADVENESGEMVNDEEDSDSSDSDSENDSSSSTSSSSSSSDEEEEVDEEDEDKEMGEVREVEEGEITNLDVLEALVGSDEDEDGETKGPFKSKNEIEVLLPVPKVDVTLESNHQTLPVGVILTIIGAKVIVEGSEKHSPLNEGSILWVTETRLPLGIVDEIFGPVKNPYYVVRYNSDQEVPAGIHEGTLVSFVAEFADHVLNDKNIYKKGYDASGENDEELSDEVEFSDDEKETEYRRAQKMTKKAAASDRKRGNQEFVDRNKVQNKGGLQRNKPWAPPPMGSAAQPPNMPKVHVQPSLNQRPGVHARPALNQHQGVHAQPAANQHPGPLFMGSMCQLPNVPNLLHSQPAAASFGCGSCTCSFGMGTPSTGGPASISPFARGEPASCSVPQHFLPFNGIWTNGMPCEPQLQMTFPNGLPMNWTPYQQQNHHHREQQTHTGFINGMPMQQHFELGQGIRPNAGVPYMQSNFSQGPSTSWPGIVGQAGFNQALPETGIQGCHARTSSKVEQQGVSSNVSFNNQSNEMQQPLSSQGNFSDQRQFNRGSTSGRGSGRRSNHRGQGSGRRSNHRGGNFRGRGR